MFRFMSSLLASMLLITAVTGCSKDEISIESKTVLTLATMFVNPALHKAVNNFNISNDQYTIDIIDYSNYDTETDNRAGYTRLVTEITSGKIPDILNLWPLLPAHPYAAKGLLEDLYPFIDSDPELSRNSLIENVRKLSEINGGFYRVFPGFYISSLLGPSSLLGEDMGWTARELRALLEANPQADIPFGTSLNSKWFLNYTVAASMDQFINHSEGTCSFESDEFIYLLELARTLPSENDYYPEESNLIAEGRQIMVEERVYRSFKYIQVYKALFDDNIVFKGFPTESGIGNSISLDHALAMTTACTDKQGAWEFLRMFLTEEFQRSYYNSTSFPGFPSNQVIFNEVLEKAMTPTLKTDEDGNEYEVSESNGFMGYQIEFFSTTQEEAEQIISVIASASFLNEHNSLDETVLMIIRESTSSYFAGASSAVEVARIIQSRVSILIAEQG